MTKCASCGIQSTATNNIKLKSCTGCHLVKYCGVECQRQHRPLHKLACKQRAAELRNEKGEEAAVCPPAPATVIETNRTLPNNVIQHGSEEMARMVENGEINPNNIFFANSYDFTLKAGTDPQEGMAEAMAEMKLLNDRRSVLQQAHLRFSCLARASYNSGLDFERYYRDLYNDIQEHHDVWFDKMFNVDNPNTTHAEYTTGILGTLCTILRQRGDLDECQEVMKTYMAVLKRFQQMSEGCGIYAQIACCEALTFKANIIRINLGAQIGDKEMAMTAFHAVVKYEKKEKAAGRYGAEDDPDFDGLLAMFFGHDDYDIIDDDDIYNVLRYMNDETAKDGPQLKPRECGYFGCDNKEEMNGDFNLCSKCHKQPYCSRECQVRDWKIHKQLCGGCKNKTNISDDGLTMIMQLLVTNYATTVSQNSKKKVSQKQKDAAAASLLKRLMKMLTGEFSHFNDQGIVNDAATDPDFCQALADFFAEQPGYEKVWGELRVGYGDSFRLQNEANDVSNTLRMSDETIRERCDEVVRLLTCQLSGRLCDGDVSKGLVKHGPLVEKLVQHTKKFLLENREYDSWSGLRNLTKDPDFSAQMADIISDVYEIEDD